MVEGPRYFDRAKVA